MAGNVWEWTRRLWGKDWVKPSFKYPYRLGDGWEDVKAHDEVLRVLRGGSWNDLQYDTHSAMRGWNLPDSRYDSIGFRVVVSPI